MIPFTCGICQNQRIGVWVWVWGVSMVVVRGWTGRGIGLSSRYSFSVEDESSGDRT